MNVKHLSSAALVATLCAGLARPVYSAFGC
jgi:hypothetical protein